MLKPDGLTVNRVSVIRQHRQSVLFLKIGATCCFLSLDEVSVVVVVDEIPVLLPLFGKWYGWERILAFWYWFVVTFFEIFN